MEKTKYDKVAEWRGMNWVQFAEVRLAVKCVVFYEDWQMECCGTKFSIGDTVKWPVIKTEQLNTPVNVGKIDYCYEAHDSNWENIFILEGKVETIKILYQKYVPSKNNPQMLIPIDGETIETEKAKGFDKNFKDMEYSGYIVTLNEYAIRRAQKEEVTFR